MDAKGFFTRPAKPIKGYAYGMLLIILALLAWNILSLPARHSHDRYINLVTVLMLLFNHLAYAFPFPSRIATFFRVLAWGWIAFGLFYIVMVLR